MASNSMWCLLLLLLWCFQVIGSSNTSCIKRWQWKVINRCPPSHIQLSAAPIYLSNEAQCVTLCTMRLPMCKAAHFNHPMCFLATNWSELSLWSSSSSSVGDQCKSWVLSPDVFQLLLFMDFRESIKNVLGSAATVTAEQFDVTRDDSGMLFGGRTSSFFKLTVPGGLSSMTDRNGERAISFFMYIRRPYKARTVYMKIGAGGDPDSCNLLEESGRISFLYHPIGRTFKSTDLTVMQTDADPNGFGFGVGVSNITSSYAFVNNKEYAFNADPSNGVVAGDTVIRLGLSTVKNEDCLNGTLVCFAIAPTKLSVEQFSKLSILCQ